jgi:hypothetical protein
MKKGLVMPVLAAVLFAAACDGGPTKADTRASVRFFNATTGMTGNGGFTTNGQFATGSALAFAQSAQTCSKVEAGSASFGFGAANPGGNGLSGSALATLNNQSVTAGGNYTVVATGSATSPQLYLLENSFSASLPSNLAAVRFVNLAPGPNPLPNVFSVFAGGLPPAGTVISTAAIVGSPTPFQAVTSGTNAFMVMLGHLLETRVDATFDVQAGTVTTIAIVPNTSDSFQMIKVPGC